MMRHYCRLPTKDVPFVTLLDNSEKIFSDWLSNKVSRIDIKRAPEIPGPEVRAAGVCRGRGPPGRPCWPAPLPDQCRGARPVIVQSSSSWYSVYFLILAALRATMTGAWRAAPSAHAVNGR